MTARYIPLEHPPFEDARSVEWLTRMMLLINGALQQVVDFTPVGSLPDKITNGTAAYFSVAILPDITTPGPWIYVEGTWRKMFI